MARKPRLLKSSSFRKVKPGEPGYVSKTATRFRVVRGKDAGEVVSNAERIKRTQGAHPTKLAEARKANPFAYKSAATREQAAKQRETRKRFTRPDWKRPSQVVHEHTFLNKAGVQQTAAFRGHWLAVMQVYRNEAWTAMLNQNGAGDFINLKKYDRMNIKDVDGVRVYPETDVNTLRALRGDGSACANCLARKAGCNVIECPWCGKTAPFIGHHVEGPFASRAAKRASKNIVNVCRNCHAKIHSRWTRLGGGGRDAPRPAPEG